MDYKIIIARLTALVDNKDITDIFHASALLLNDNLESEFSIQYDKSDKTIVYLKEGLWVGQNEETFFKNLLQGQKIFILNNIDVALLQIYSEKEKIVLLQNINTSFSFILSAFNKKSDSFKKTFKVYGDVCTEIKDSINSRIYNLKGNTENGIVQDSPKIKWTKDAASLCNLFYDLMVGNTYDSAGNKIERSYISNNINEVASFLFAHFEIQEGKPELESYKRYLKGGKPAKKYGAQARINE